MGRGGKLYMQLSHRRAINKIKKKKLVIHFSSLRAALELFLVASIFLVFPVYSRFAT